MEQAPNLKGLCSQVLPEGQQLLILLTEYLPVPLLLISAFIGVVAVLYLAARAVQATLRALRASNRRVASVAVGTRSPLPQLALGREALALVAARSPRRERTENVCGSPETPVDPKPNVEFGILAHFRPGPATPPATPRNRVRRPRNPVPPNGASPQRS